MRRVAVILGQLLASSIFYLCHGLSGVGRHRHPLSDVSTGNNTVNQHPTLDTEAADPCSHCLTTLEIVDCLSKQIEQAQLSHDKYVAAARKRLVSYEKLADQDLYKRWAREARDGFDASQTAWQKFCDEQCSAIYMHWAQGSICSIKRAECHLRLIQRRTHDVWENYLCFEDSTPPILPEPQHSDTHPGALIGY